MTELSHIYKIQNSKNQKRRYLYRKGRRNSLDVTTPFRFQGDRSIN